MNELCGLIEGQGRAPGVEPGVAERFMRLINEQCLWVEEFTDMEDARRKITAFIERYRHGYRTPAQVLAQALEIAA